MNVPPPAEEPLSLDDDDQASADFDEPAPSEGSWWRRQSGLLKATIGGCSAVVACLMVVLVWVAVTRHNTSRAAGPARDYEVYTRELMARTPLEPDEFTRKGMVAESYVKDDVYPLFREVTIKLDPPVRLKDAVSGETNIYTRARLIRNNPAPPQGAVGRVRGNWSRAQFAATEPFAWAGVEMKR